MRDENLQSLRPTIATNNTEATAVERFQNETLRPILKLQHDLIIMSFKNYIALHKNEFNHLPKAQRPNYIEQVIKQDTKFRNRLLGCIIGHFTLSELSFFLDHESELSRRTIQLIIQRIQSVF
jgi:hypothetical protein